MKDYEKTSIKWGKFYKNFKSITKIKKHNKINLSKLLFQKIYIKLDPLIKVKA